MPVTIISWDKLSTEELNRLSELTLNNGGERLSGLLVNHIRVKNPDTKVLLYTFRGEIRGWSAYMQGTSKQAMFYVDREHRRKGIGTRLLKAVEKIAAKDEDLVRVQGWDDRSMGFFRQAKEITTWLFR